MTGYSGTPLARKLGIREGTRLLVLEGPADYAERLSPVPAGVVWQREAGADTDIAQVFAVRRDALEQLLTALRAALRADAAIWVSWPKKASKVATDITEDTVRELALPLGLVDIKVCAVTEVWSGLKLVVRKALR